MCSSDLAAAIADYRKALAGATALLALEKLAAGPVGAKLPMHSALDGALAEMAKLLAA